MTYREFLIIFETKYLEEWDRVTAITHEISMLTVVTQNINRDPKKPPVKFKTFTQRHPFRVKTGEGISINADNLKTTLFDIAKASTTQ